MGKIEPLAPSKRVRIVLCSAAFAIAAIVPGAGFSAEWSSGVKSPTAEWSSAEWSSAEWSSGKAAPKAEWSSAEWSSGKRAPRAEWSSGKAAPKAEWSSRYKVNSLR
jgi:hypothetical protein